MKFDTKYLLLATISGAIVALDQMTKIYVHSNFAVGESVTVIPNFFNLTYVRNPGAAFGFMSHANETFRTLFFLSMPPIAMVIILAILRGVPGKDRIQVIALCSIFGGAVGNYIDRLRFGFVVDFLDFHYKGTWSYPAFNVADSAIVSGVVVLIALMFLEEKRKKIKPS